MYNSKLFDGRTNWSVAVDLERQLAFPAEITLTTQFPDLVI